MSFWELAYFHYGTDTPRVDKMRGISWFCRVVEAGSFVAAARSIDVVPSALSKTLAALERELGFPLLHRSTRRLALTEEGAIYYDRCRMLLVDLEETEASARDGKQKPRGMLRVGLHPAFRGLTLRALGKLLDDQPDLRIETVITNSISAVLEERLDLLIHVGELASCGMISQRIADSKSVVCASPAYLAARGEPRHPRDLVHHRALVFNRQDEAPNAKWAFARDDERLVIEVPVRLTSRDGVGLIDAMVGGCGIGRTSEFPVRQFVDSNVLKVLLPGWEGRTLPVHAVWPSNGARMSAKTQVFLEFARNLMKTE
jgi:LysR family transcriptional regulator for bpeEF and oprC